MKRLLLMLLLLAPLPAAADDCMPFKGEHMSFAVGWEFINAGTATMDVVPTKQGWRINTLAKTNKFFDMFKKVRDNIITEGFCRDGAMQSTVFDVEQHENVYNAAKQTRFLWQENKATFRQNNVTDSYDAPAGTLSVMDAFFKTRMLDLKPGQPVSIPVFDSRKLYEVVVDINKKTEKLIAPWGESVECLVMQPRLKTEGIFSSIGVIKIWVTNDARRIPLKVTAAIKFGRIVATLTDYRRAP